jgi:hypothetical protein
MLLLPNPKRLMFGYLCGAYLTSITLGCIIVFNFSDSSAAQTTQHTVNPLVNIAFGAIALIAAFVLHTGRHEQLAERRRARREAQPKGPPRWQRELGKGSPRATFVVGSLLTLPGGSYLAGLYNINKLDYGGPETVLLVIGFNVVMMWLLEVPLLAYVLAPETTPARIERIKAWGRAHGHVIAVRGLTGLGALFVLKGVVGLLN